MLKVGVQTKGIITGNCADEGCAQIAAAGFDCIDFNLDAYLTNTNVYEGKLNSFFDKTVDELIEYFTPLKEAMEKYGLTASQMHAPYPVKVRLKDAQNEYMCTKVIPKSFAIAQFLGVPYMVIHPIKLQYKEGKKAELQENLSFYRSLFPFIARTGVKVCVENLYEGIGERLIEGPCAEAEEAIYYIDTLNAEAGEEWFGICLDTGHMNLVHRQPYDFIHKLGNRIKLLHLHDNDGIADIHQLPFTFAEGGVDWEQVLRGLHDISYRGVLSFETFPTMKSFPKHAREALLKQIEQTGRYFAGRIV